MDSKPRSSSDQVTQYIEAPEWLEKKTQFNLEMLLDLDPKKDFNRAAVLVVHHFQQAHKRALEYQERTGGNTLYIGKLRDNKEKIVRMLKAAAHYFSNAIEQEGNTIDITEPKVVSFGVKHSNKLQTRAVKNNVKIDLALVARFYGLSLDDLQK